MYAALWRLLPGPIWLRILLALAIAAAVIVALATWVYPALDAAVFPANEVVTPSRRGA